MLHGRVRLDFCDALTGKVKERVEGNNTFTDAINSLLNKAPMGCDRGQLGCSKVNGESVMDLAHTALGGVLLFPETVGNGLYEPLTHQPTAYSRYGARDELDSKTGAWTNESIAIEGGFRFVHEWGASYGNGTIKTVCLTNKYGAEAYGSKTYFGDKWRFTLGDMVSSRMIGFCGDYFYFIDNHRYFNNGNKIKRIRRPRGEMLINQAPWSSEGIDSDFEYVCDTDYSRVGISEADQKIYVLKGAYNSNKTLDVIDLTDGTVTTSTLQNTSSIHAGQSNYYHGICKRGNYIYFVENVSGTSGTVMKLNITNTADVNTISVTIPARAGEIYLTEDTNEIIGNGFIIDTADVVHVTETTNGIAVGNRFGVWQAFDEQDRTTSGSLDPLIWQINPYYMATKFVLEDAVTKTSALTMKLVYEVTHT